MPMTKYINAPSITDHLNFTAKLVKIFFALNVRGTAESHQHHHYDEFAKYKQEIATCLGPVNKRIQEVTDRYISSF